MKLRTLLKPKMFVPLVLTGALLFVAFSLGNVGQVLDRLRAIPLASLAIALGFAAAYLVLKALQLRHLLGRLGAPMEWRLFLLAYAVGELAANLPLGIFAQNWVLSRQPRTRFARSSAATSYMLLSELGVALLLVAVVGIPGWAWTRAVAALVLVGTVGLLYVLIRFEPLLQRRAGRSKRKWLHTAIDNATDLVNGLRRLSRWRVLVVNVLLVSAYLGVLACAFVVVGRSMGVQPLHYLQAAVVYAFSLAAVLMGGGIVGQVGSMEVLGMKAAHQWGVGYTDGLALMLGFRLVWIGSIWLLAGPVVLWLRRLLKPLPQGPHAVSDAPPAASRQPAAED